MQVLQEICEARRPFDWDCAGLEGAGAKPLRETRGPQAAPSGFIRDSWERASRRDRYAKFSVIAGYFDRAETKVRPPDGALRDYFF